MSCHLELSSKYYQVRSLAFQDGSSLTPTSLVSSLSVMHLLDKGCQGFLAVTQKVDVEVQMP